MCHGTAFAMDPEGCAEDMGDDAQAFGGLISSFREDPLGTALSVVTGGCPDEEGLSAELGCLTAHVLSIAIVRKATSARASVGLGDDALAPRSIAFRAADNVDDFTVPLKHEPWASGNYARFAEGVDQHALIREALRSDGAMFLPNNRAGSFRVLYDFGRPIGTRGETGLRVVVGNDGRIWTAFPLKP
jgi:hypothetical protein